MDADRIAEAARIVRLAGRDDLADALLLYSSGGPVVSALRDLLDEIKALREDQRKGFSDLRSELHDRTKTPTPRPGSKGPPVDRIVDLIVENPRVAIGVLLAIAAMMSGGPDIVGRLMDMTLGPDVAQVQVAPAPRGTPGFHVSEAD